MQRQSKTSRGVHPRFKVLHSCLELLVGCLECTSAVSNLPLLSLKLLEALHCILLLLLQGTTLG